MQNRAPKAEVSLFESEFALSEVFDFNFETRLRKKYAILASPRTGSTMLASALYNSGLAGAPFEYFHHNLLKLRDNPEKRPNELNLYLEEIIRRRTSPNGYFGIKIHFSQFEYLFGGNMKATEVGLKFIDEFDKHILITRRDKILQAISSLLADEKKVYSRMSITEDELLGREFQQDDVVAITSYLNVFIQWDAAWRTILEKLNKPFIEVAYEDLCTDPQIEFRRIFAFLDIENASGDEISFSTEKQTNTRLTAKLKSDYLDHIGASPVA